MEGRALRSSRRDLASDRLTVRAALSTHRDPTPLGEGPGRRWTRPLGAVLANTELFDPESETWSDAGCTVNPRWLHTATLLPSGAVLVAGGAGSSSAELYGIIVSPAQVSLAPGASQTFTAKGGSGLGYVWSFVHNESGGTLTASGDYQAGPVGGVTDVVQVVDSFANSSTATVNVLRQRRPSPRQRRRRSPWAVRPPVVPPCRRWVSPSCFFSAGARREPRVAPLVDGRFALNAGGASWTATISIDGTVSPPPCWLAATNDVSRYDIVLGGKAYLQYHEVFVSPSPVSCDRYAELVLADGTSCGFINITGTATCGRVTVALGLDGTLSALDQASCTLSFWPRAFASP